MKKTAFFSATLAIILSSCASSSGTDDELVRCEYNGAEFFCPQNNACGPGRCIVDPHEECGMSLLKCGEFEVCRDGACLCQTKDGGYEKCTANTECCTDGCTDILNDAKNCGKCGNTCKNGEICQNGGCTTSCTSPLSTCPGAGGGIECRDLTSDINNCGACANACPMTGPHVETGVCLSSQCTVICESGWADANNNPADGCEAKSTAVCGDGLIGDGEKCDGTHLNDQTCASVVGSGSTGKLRCSDDCHDFDTLGCSKPTTCGNGSLDDGEKCDGSNLGGATCESLVGTGSAGTPICNTNCSGFNVTACSKPNSCGNGIVDESEKCDGAVAEGASCATIVGNGSKGSLKCAENCAGYDVSGCTASSACGNDKLEDGEECDSSQFGNATCASVFGAGSMGSLKCSNSCTIDTSGCSAPTTCGDGKINGNDVCDASALNGKTCADILGPGSTGTLKCRENCSDYDISGCSAPSSCNNGKIENGEVCDGQRLNDKTCATEVGSGSTGTLVCNDKCTGFITTGCSKGTTCGNNKLDKGEVCDGDQFNGKTCESEAGKGSKGKLICSSDCKSISLSQCSAANLCGNGTLDKTAGEICDGTNLAGETCASIVGKGSKGTLKCGDGCMHFDISGCSASEYCGDGRIQNNEICDLGNVAGRTCESVVGTGSTGTLLCNSTCNGYDKSRCSAVNTCGDGSLESGEVCDGQFLNGWTCEKQVGPGSTGTPKCNPTCTGYENGTCTAAKTCGDNKLDTGEDCDGTKFKNGITSCKAYNDKAYASGNLSCTKSCTIDTGACKAAATAVCGNGTIEAGEVCDKTQFNGATCSSLLKKPDATGTLTCASDCKSILFTNCSYCGDGKLKNDATEECDGNQWMVSNCVEYSGSSGLYSGGTLKCNASTCQFDVSACTLKSTTRECEEASVRCTADSSPVLQLCDNAVWTPVSVCEKDRPYCDASREDCLPVSWCNIQNVKKEGSTWKGYGRILLDSSLSPDAAYLYCTQNLTTPVQDWAGALYAGKPDIITTELNTTCLDCGYNTEFITDEPFDMPSGTSYCTFVFDFGEDSYACLPIKSGKSVPIPLTKTLKLTAETSYVVHN